MNIFLQFKKKSHSLAYDHDLELQVTKRLWMVVVAAITNLSSMFTNWGILKKVQVGTYELTKTIAILLLLAGLILLKCKFHKVKKYLGKINFLLDLFLIYCSFMPYPWVNPNQFDIFTKLETVTAMWSISLLCFTCTYAIANWWLRATIPMIQIISYLVPTVQRAQIPILGKFILVACIHCLILYFCTIYIYELFQRKDFLEKRKVYENYEAIMRIFDDIIQGVIIVDPNYNLIYSNRTFRSIFNQDSRSRPVESLFSQIRVKSINPQLENFTTERILTTTQEESVIYI